MSKVACGFVPDTVKLVKTFAEKESFDLKDFSEIWNKQKFSLIFLGRPNEKELLEFMRHTFRAALELFCKYTENKYEHVGYLYVLLGLVRCQPPIIKPRMKIRVTLEHFEVIEKLRDEAEENKIVGALYAIRYLIHNGFDFVCAPTLMGPSLSASATNVDLSTEPPPKEIDDSTEMACKFQEDIETCFQELKIIKTEYEKDLRKANVKGTPYAIKNNIPFQALIDVLEPYTPGSSNRDQISYLLKNIPLDELDSGS
ncbi:uncharacterized protein LOC129231675 [Uloborus diversus]|uniref:uncharacterized protein LOC129231675 n=1 Tax=Uloborus diversus TaxID=327109 RepID=UPI00240A77E9|nr:uncharacterized protein LOC129231675 [Uloborus diversus]